MAYKHGVYTSEIPTSIVPPVETTAGLPVIFGTAPLHLATDPAEANRPVLCYTYAEAVAAFGYSDDWKSYTLCEAIYSQFALYNRAPVVLVNVLDPATHKKTTTEAELTLSNGSASISAPAMPSTLVVKSAAAGQPLVKGTDYEAEHDDDGNLVITVLADGALKSASKIYVSYDAVDASAVDADDIIGCVDADTGTLKGLECLSEVYALTGLVPGIVLAPGWSDNSEVAAIMATKAASINNLFSAIALVDCDSKTVTKYTDVPAWKNKNNYTNKYQVALWPCVKLGEKVYHMSTAALGVMATVDSNNDDVPYASPSNNTLEGDGLCLEDGTEVVMTHEQAVYLNGQGIVTGLNFVGGLKLFGNNMACYPSNTDPKDRFIPVRRMFNWQQQTFILTYWQKLDNPMNKRLIQTCIDSENIRLNGLTSAGYILGGRMEFQEAENATTDLLNGKITFHTYITPPVPAKEIENKFEYDPDYFKTLFA